MLTEISLFHQDVPVEDPEPRRSSGPCPGRQSPAVCASGTPARPQCAPHKGPPLQAEGKREETALKKQNTISHTQQPPAILVISCVFSHSLHVDQCVQCSSLYRDQTLHSGIHRYSSPRQHTITELLPSAL